MNNLTQRRATNLFVVIIILLSLAFLSFGSSAVSQGPELMSGAEIFAVFRAGDANVFSYTPPPEGFEVGVKTATITVNWVGSWASNAQAAFQHAVDIWETQVTSSVPIVINAEWKPLGQYILGQCGAANYARNFTGATRSNTWYAIALANKLAGSDLDPGNPDMNASFNSDMNWYYGTDGQTPAGQYDLVTTVTHEICHGLGFLGTMNVDAYGQGSWGSGTGAPMIYDHFAINGYNQSLIDTSLFANPSVALANQLLSNNLFFNGANAVAAAGGNPPKLYAPSTWETGSSYSHLDENTYNGTPNALMTPVGGMAEANHDPGPIVRGILKDMGWTVDVATPTHTATTTETPPTSTTTPTITGTPPTPTNTPTPSTFLPFIRKEPSPGRLEIVNDTGGTLTFTLSGLGTRTFGPGTSYWENIPPGTYSFTATVTGGQCSGTVSDSVTISSGQTERIRFYCSAGSAFMVGGG